MSRFAAHFRELGLDAAAVHDKGAVKRAYYKLALSRHPDKGGTKEAFQKLLASFNTLIKAEPWTSNARQPPATTPSSSSRPAPGSAERSTKPRASSERRKRHEHHANHGDDDGDHDGDDGDDGEWRDWHYDYFRHAHKEAGFEDFDARREAMAKERARRRALNVKNMRDYRDKRGKSGTRCSTCGERDGITKEDARCDDYFTHSK